ncbi:MAG TPA: hypothetical protein VEW69_04425, partial [Alphaproteobacteria bacterium]|nr:hypothetical protein [Alphaproteobacteria bacterium]
EFANGPYSARAIAQQSRTPTMMSHPGENDPRTAALFFLKVSRLNLGQGLAEYLLFAIAFIALLAMIYFARSFLPWIVLWAPVPFYIACVAWGSVPIYFPDWWPHSYYNVRYGLQMLPAVAVFFALAFEFAIKFMPAKRVAILVFIIFGISYSSVWLHGPICLGEAIANSGTRIAFEAKLATELKKLPASATLMMDCSAHSEALQMAGIPFRRVLRESNSPAWQIALSQPTQSADYIIAVAGDDVFWAVRVFPRGLKAVATVDTPDHPGAVIYRSVH